MCKVSGARLAILMVVFCHNPAHLPNSSLSREAIREVSCPNRLETYNVYLHKLPLQRVSFPEARRSSFIFDHFYTCTTKPIRQCRITYSFDNNLHDFYAQNTNVKKFNGYSIYLSPALHASKVSLPPVTSCPINLKNFLPSLTFYWIYVGVTAPLHAPTWQYCTHKVFWLSLHNGNNCSF